MTKLERLVLLLTVLSSALTTQADSLEVSVLTCEPGKAIYELYGHTAIRVRDVLHGERDAVFNYGVFDFNAPGFVPRFVRGETDYEVWAIPYRYVHDEYVDEHRRVWQQTLALDSAQKEQILSLLIDNCQPDKRKYRYNFLYDNCTTRCRDVLEAVADVVWPVGEEKTYREIIHEFAGMPHKTWNALGQDLLLGRGVDTLVGVREQMFSPIYFMRYLDQCTLQGRPLVQDTRLIIAPDASAEGQFCTVLPTFPAVGWDAFPPLLAGILWLALGLVLMVKKKTGRMAWIVTTLVVLLALTLLIDYMHLFSSHPTVDTNVLVWILNPLLIFLAVLPWLRKRYCVLAPATLLMSTSAMGQEAPRTAPRLVVIISVDQLRTDYLEAFMPLFGDKGLKRLMREGCLYTAAQYPFAHPDGTSAPACLFSGTSPYDNGVVGSVYLNRETLRPTSAVDKFTPQLLAVSTLTDELKLATEGKAVIFSIAPEAGAAIFSAGHAANGALWLNPRTALWSSSEYYGTPLWLTNFNRSDRTGIGDTWEPFSPTSGSVNYYVGGGVKVPFKHRLQNAQEFATSALVNDKISYCAVQCLHATAMGRDAVPDILAVTYYAGGWQHQTIEACGMELQDTYVRLDQAIATLINEAETIAGIDNLLVVLTSTGYCDEDVPNLDAYRIPTGTFNMSRARSLLNMYLSAVYGAGNYVEAVFGNGLYLNHKLLERKQINGVELLERSQDLLLQMSGVKDVYTTNRLALGAWTPGVRALRNSHHPKYKGDIMVSVASGWHITDDEAHTNQFSRESYIPFPLVFWGAGVHTAKIDTPIELDCVAPTVAGILRIRSPNACAAPPLTGIR